MERTPQPEGWASSSLPSESYWRRSNVGLRAACRAGARVRAPSSQFTLRSGNPVKITCFICGDLAGVSAHPADSAPDTVEIPANAVLQTESCYLRCQRGR